MAEPIDRTNKGFVEHWRRVGPILEAIRLQELRDFDHEKELPILDALLQLGVDYGIAPPTSGLIELQRLLAKGQEKKGKPEKSDK